MGDQERIPIRALGLDPGEMGRYDDEGNVRETVWRSSEETVYRYGTQEGHTPEEASKALDGVARGLRRARRKIREERAK
jgi:hypothetical protein